MTSISLPNMAQIAFEDKASPSASLWHSIFAATVASRTRQAQNRVRAYVEGQSEERLAGLGFTAADIASIRCGTPVGEVLARRICQAA